MGNTHSSSGNIPDEYEAFPAEVFPFTSRILSHSPLPPLEGPEGVAERLLILLHYGTDFGVWGGHRKPKYWGALQERVIAAAYTGAGLAGWWSRMSELLPSAPRNAAEREETGILICYPRGDDTVRALRRNAPALTLRTRIAAERYKEDRWGGEGTP